MSTYAISVYSLVASVNSVKKIEISKIQDGGGRHLDKSKSKIAIPRPVSVTMRTVQSWTCELAYGADTIFHRTYF